MKKHEAQAYRGKFYRVTRDQESLKAGDIVETHAWANGYGRWAVEISHTKDKQIRVDPLVIFKAKDLAQLSDPTRFVPFSWPVPALGQHYKQADAGKIKLWKVGEIDGDRVTLFRIGGRRYDQQRNYHTLQGIATSESLVPVPPPFATNVRVTAFKTRDLRYRLCVRPRMMPDKTPDGHVINYAGMHPMMLAMMRRGDHFLNFADHFMARGFW